MKFKDFAHMALTGAAESATYTNWTAEFALNNVNNGFVHAKQQLQKHRVDFTLMTRAELEEWGFQQWDQNGLMLLPLYLMGSLRRGTVVTYISGETRIVGVDALNTDHRWGHLAYGIFPKEAGF